MYEKCWRGGRIGYSVGGMIFLRNSNTTLQANCYILADDNQRVALVVDPGAKSTPWVKSALQKHGLTLSAVLLTHAHADHCWDAPAIAGENTPVYVATPDLYRLDDPAHYTGFSASPFERESGRPWERPARVEEIPPALFVGGGAELVPGVALRAIPMPGHTEGSTIFLFGGTITPNEETPQLPDTASEQYLLTGDVLFAGSIGRTDLPGGDDREMVQSLRTLSQIIAPDTAFFPGHGHPSTIAVEAELNPYLRHACASDI